MIYEGLQAGTARLLAIEIGLHSVTMFSPTASSYYMPIMDGRFILCISRDRIGCVALAKYKWFTVGLLILWHLLMFYAFWLILMIFVCLSVMRWFWWITLHWSAFKSLIYHVINILLSPIWYTRNNPIDWICCHFGLPDWQTKVDSGSA